MLLILLGDGAVANATLEKSGMKGAGPVQITIAWGFAVMVPACIFGRASGAHFNPALTLALALDGSFDWAMLPGYWLAQFAGAFAGACLVFALYRNHLQATESQAVKRGVFCTSPAIPDFASNLLGEAAATFVLVLALKGMGQLPGLADGVDKLLVFGVITSVGMSFGGLTGYALNPARDLGPRLAYTLLPIRGKGGSDWGYALVPLLGPVCGAVAAAALYAAIPFA